MVGVIYGICDQIRLLCINYAQIQIYHMSLNRELERMVSPQKPLLKVRHFTFQDVETASIRVQLPYCSNLSHNFSTVKATKTSPKTALVKLESLSLTNSRKGVGNRLMSSDETSCRKSNEPLGAECLSLDLSKSRQKGFPATKPRRRKKGVKKEDERVNLSYSMKGREDGLFVESEINKLQKIKQELTRASTEENPALQTGIFRKRSFILKRAASLKRMLSGKWGCKRPIELHISQ